MSEYRHEYKYLISSAQASVLEMRMRGMLQPDPHADESGAYQIKSLYFDDSEDTCFFENENGTDPRSKFRIRCYNHSLERISLEKKSKMRGMTKKESCFISKEVCEILMGGRDLRLGEGLDGTQKFLLSQLKLRRLRPKVIVSYERKPFVCPIGNVRVTFDRKLSSSSAVESFLKEELPLRPALATGSCILEVKWDEILPSYVRQALSTGTLQWSGCSKYYLCRKYSTNGGMRV